MKLVICIPTLCRESLFTTLLSLHEQTDQDFSIVLVKDSNEPLPGNVTKHFDLTVLDGAKCNNVTKTRNIGIKYAREHFDWLAWVDDDDFLHPQYVEWLKDHIKRTRADVVLFRAAGITDHLPLDYVVPEAGRYDIVVGASTIAYAFDLKKGSLMNEDIMKGEDYQFLKTSVEEDLNVIISNHVAYGIRKPVKPNTQKFPLVVLT